MPKGAPPCGFGKVTTMHHRSLDTVDPYFHFIPSTIF